MHMDERKLIVLSGPSGCGKDTVLRRMREMDPAIKVNVSFTTRAPRPGEMDGINYHFITKEQFLKNITDGLMLEYNEYAGNYYGTSRETIDALLSEGNTVVLIIDVHGGKNVKTEYPGAMLMFLMPPTLEALTERINKRGKMSREELDARMKIAQEEILYAQHYDRIIINDDIDICAQECLEAIMEWQETEIETENNNNTEPEEE